MSIKNFNLVSLQCWGYAVRAQFRKLRIYRVITGIPKTNAQTTPPVRTIKDHFECTTLREAPEGLWRIIGTHQLLVFLLIIADRCPQGIRICGQELEDRINIGMVLKRFSNEPLHAQ
jgi:hypothetical protein